MSSKHTNLGKYTLTALKRHFDLVPKDLGPDAHRSRLGMTFDTKSWEIEDIGHLCVMRMNAFLGLMKMETIVIAPTHADLPLFNVDWVKAFGTETLLAELYDTQLAPWPENAPEKFEEIKATYDDIEDYSAGAHWYDSVLYPASFHKKGKGCTDRFNKAAKEYIDLFALQLSKSKKCPAGPKSARIRTFAETLVENDGPAVSMMAKLFGEETMRRIVLKHMYGVG